MSVAQKHQDIIAEFYQLTVVEQKNKAWARQQIMAKYYIGYARLSIILNYKIKKVPC